ncbi:hypothetical protein Scep_025227 [Stephania cephalantha]|uniref:Uncharacterized protein n=1 Tax=Stephania cephalantha TaxID=152367 RepID=A0AAP0EQ74_9MAGN
MTRGVLGEGERAPKGRREDMKERREGDGGHGLWWLLLVGGGGKEGLEELRRRMGSPGTYREAGRTDGGNSRGGGSEMTLKGCGNALRFLSKRRERTCDDPSPN